MLDLSILNRASLHASSVSSEDQQKMPTLSCAVRDDSQSKEANHPQCSRCHDRLMAVSSASIFGVSLSMMSSLRKKLGRDCQQADSKTHKRSCALPRNSSYEKYRHSRDAPFHEGDLELSADHMGVRVRTHWLWTFARRKFGKAFGGDEETVRA
jgi:hypothetical protein